MKYKHKLWLSVIMLIFLASIQIVHASNLNNAWDGVSDVAKDAGYNTRETDIVVLIGVIIQSALTLLGVVFLVLMVYGGYLWMTDRGNEDQVKRSKALISAAIIGLGIVVSAYAISYFVISKLTVDILQTLPAQPGG